MHDGTIATRVPNVMWGTDAMRVFTLDSGSVWIFAAVESGTRSVSGGTCVRS